jgi:hypothetical protein
MSYKLRFIESSMLVQVLIRNLLLNTAAYLYSLAAQSSSEARELLEGLFVSRSGSELAVMRSLMTELCISVFHGGEDSGINRTQMRENMNETGFGEPALPPSILGTIPWPPTSAV